MIYDFYAASLDEVAEAFSWLSVKPESPQPPAPRTAAEYEAFEDWLSEQPLIEPDPVSYERMGHLPGFEFHFVTPDVLQSLERCFGLVPSAAFARGIVRSYAGHFLDEVSPDLCARLAAMSAQQIETAVIPQWPSVHDGQFSEDLAFDFATLLAQLSVGARSERRKIFQFLQPM